MASETLRTSSLYFLDRSNISLQAQPYDLPMYDDAFMHLRKVYRLAGLQWGIVGKLGNHQPVQVHWTSLTSWRTATRWHLYAFYRERGPLYSALLGDLKIHSHNTFSKDKPAYRYSSNLSFQFQHSRICLIVIIKNYISRGHCFLVSFILVSISEFS